MKELPYCTSYHTSYDLPGEDEMPSSFSVVIQTLQLVPTGDNVCYLILANLYHCLAESCGVVWERSVSFSAGCWKSPLVGLELSH
jgi:hypothetical protein